MGHSICIRTFSVCSVNGREQLHAKCYVKCTGETLCERSGIKNYTII